MVIAIDLTPLYNRKFTGVERYAVDLYKALINIGANVVPIFHAVNDIDNNPNAYIIPKTNRLLLENICLCKAIKVIEADITIFPIFPPPINCYGYKTKIVPVVHDLTFKKYRTTQNSAAKYYYTPKTILALKKSEAIITISETVRKELTSITPLCIYNCGENISTDFWHSQRFINIDFLKKWYLYPNEYLISVSTIEPRKNFKYLLKIMKPYLIKTNMKLVLVGRKGWGKDKELGTLIEEMGDLLVFTEYVSHECLVSLYHYANAFVLLSIYEGFGRTPFEAVACGCRKIILSDIPIFRETFGNSALFLPLNDVKKCQAIMDHLLEMPKIDEGFIIPFNILEQRLPYVLNSIITNKKSNIPHILHYCWLGGRKMSHILKQCVKTFPRIGDVDIIRWDDYAIVNGKNAYLQNMIAKKKWAFVSDYIRLKVLYEQGGIYVDTDIQVCKQIPNEFYEANMILGYAYDDIVSTAFIMVKPRHPFVKYLLDKMEEFDGKDIVVNNGFVTKALLDFFPDFILDGKYHEFAPNSYIYPRYFFDSATYNEEGGYTIHHGVGSWSQPKWLILRWLRPYVKLLRFYVKPFGVWYQGRVNKKMVEGSGKFLEIYKECNRQSR